MSISAQNGGRGCERLIWLSYYLVLKLQITFNLGLLPKIRITSKKNFKWKLFKIEFCLEKSASACVYLPMERSEILRKINMVLLYGTKTKNYIHLGLNAAKNTHYFKESFKLKLFKIEICTKKSGSAYFKNFY